MNGVLEEEVLMKQPEGFVAKGHEHLVCKLKHSGLKQSPRCWNSVLNKYLKERDFYSQQVILVYIYMLLQRARCSYMSVWMTSS